MSSLQNGRRVSFLTQGINRGKDWSGETSIRSGRGNLARVTWKQVEEKTQQFPSQMAFVWWRSIYLYSTTGFLNRFALTNSIVLETGHQMINFNIAPCYQVSAGYPFAQSVVVVLVSSRSRQSYPHAMENLEIFHPFSSPRRQLRRRHYSFCTTFVREISLFHT